MTLLSRISVLLLTLTSASTFAANESDDGNVVINAIEIVQPNPELREVYEANIDSEFFELGAYTGLLSIEDFGSAMVTGLKASFHATEDFFLQANLAQADVPVSANEKLGDTRYLNNRNYEYYNLLVGYNLFPGETFFTQKQTFNSAFYLVAGVGNTRLNGDQHFTITLGSGYRIVLKDWLTFNLDMRDHSYESEIFGSSKRSHNLEFSGGLTAFF